MLRSRCLFFCLIFVFFTASTFAASDDEQSVFNETLLIGDWHFHFSHHLFDVANPESGRLTVTKSDPDAAFMGGFFTLNGKFISLHDFLRGTEVMKMNKCENR